MGGFQPAHPLWQLPVFVRGGSIFDLGTATVFYPQGDSTYVSYNDDDLQDYRQTGHDDHPHPLGGKQPEDHH